MKYIIIICCKIARLALMDVGIGAVWKVARVEEGSIVAIFGLGAVGLAVIFYYLDIIFNVSHKLCKL